HLSVDVIALDCDFYAFSAHKMYGPSGVGVLYGKEELLNNMVPFQSGGEMIDRVSFDKGTSYNQLPFKFEAGTPNIAGVIAFAKAIDFINANLDDKLFHYERCLTDYTMQQLSKIPEVQFVVKGKPDIPVISFMLNGHHNHDIASSLDTFGIAVRSGHHCAMPLMDYLAITGCLRISLAAYNTYAEVDFFIDKLKEILTIDNHRVELDENSSESHSITKSASDKILTLFENCKGWDGRHRQIMLLGKQLKPMPDEKKNENSLIKGCESLAWLTSTKDSQGNFYFQAYSDAKVIRGLLVIILAAFNYKNSQQIGQFDLDGYFDKLGLIKHLSPSRGNGVRAIIDKIQSLTQ
ncbi:MAG: aminotransferase class V-fold PLP-dependent enzyme, partial [Colwellia sp.]|nr:aminotransferase class V-fold PLP-dependent enzyme [Colwellia sp.]